MNTQTISQLVQQFQSRTTAPLGVVLRDLQTGQTVSHRGDQIFPTASSYKIFILAELFRQASAGICSLSDRISMTAGHKSVGSGVLAQLSPGLNMTLKDYATLMMILSDNTATDVLFHFLGGDAIRTNVLQPLGLTHTKCDLCCNDLVSAYYELNGRSFAQLTADNGGHYPSYRNSRWFRCDVEENDESTPLEMARMLELLYRGQWVSPQVCSDMLTIMKACQTNTRIPRLLPFGTPIAHKTGTLDKLMADVGIVYTPKGDYILCLFYNGNLASEEEYSSNYLGRAGDALLAELSGALYRAYIES